MSAKKQFLNACQRAHDQHWKTYAQRVMEILERENGELNKLIGDMKVWFDCKNQDMDIVNLMIALFIESMWSLPYIGHSAAESIRLDMSGNKSDRDYAIGGGQDYLLSITREMYLTYHRYVDDVCVRQMNMKDSIMTIVHLIAMTVRRQHSYDCIGSAVKKILSTRPGQA